MAKKSKGLDRFASVLQMQTNPEDTKELEERAERLGLDRSFKPTFLKSDQIKVLPELEMYIRKQDEEEFKEFKESINNEGIRDALVITSINNENILIDGHHRFRVGSELNISNFPCKKLDFDSIDAIKIWMLKNQLGRRNLTDAERIDIADKLTEFLIPLAKKQQLYKGKKSVLPNLVKQKSINRVEEIAKISGASKGNVIKFRKVKKEASPEELNKVLSGEKSIHKSFTELKKEKSTTLKDSSLQEKLDEHFSISNSEINISQLKKHIDEIRFQLDNIEGFLSENDKKSALIKTSILIEAVSKMRNDLEK